MDPVPAPPPDDLHVWFNQEGWKLDPAELRAHLTRIGVDDDVIVELIDEGADRRRSSVPLEPRPATGQDMEGPSRGVVPAPVRRTEDSSPARDQQVGGTLVPFPTPEPPNGLVPPQNLEAEEGVLGAMMISPGAIAAVSEVLDGSDFYRESHAKIYRAALHLYGNGDPVDAITLTDELEERGELESVGGRVRMHELAALVPASSHAGHYAKIVREAATLRGLIRAGGEIARFGWERPGDAAALVEQAADIVFGLQQQRASEGSEHGSASVARTFQRMTELAEAGVDIVGTPTGLRDLDRLTSGFEPGNLVILAARPSMGKSGLALAMAANVAIRKRTPVAFYTLEMSKSEVTQRLLAREAHVDSRKLRTPGRSVADDEWSRLAHAAGSLEKAPIYLNDCDSTLLAIRADLRRLKAREKTLGLVIVDYLQLMSQEAENRTQEVTKISRGLKLLAKDIDVPIVALSQLNRNLEARTDKRPTLSDLRESGSIEQDADLVLFLYRDHVYNPETADPALAELILAKHRNGPTGMCNLSFVAKEATFTDLEPRHIPGDMGGAW